MRLGSENHPLASNRMPCQENLAARSARRTRPKTSCASRSGSRTVRSRASAPPDAVPYPTGVLPRRRPTSSSAPQRISAGTLTSARPSPRRVPGETRILVAAKNFHRALSRPDGVGQGHHHVAVPTVKFRVERHRVVFHVGANVTLEPQVANFVVPYPADTFRGQRRSAFFAPEPEAGDGDRCHQVRPLEWPSLGRSARRERNPTASAVRTCQDARVTRCSPERIAPP